MGPRRVGPHRVGSQNLEKVEAPKGVAPKGGGSQKFRAFFPSPATKFVLFFPLWVSFRGILVVLKRRALSTFLPEASKPLSSPSPFNLEASLEGPGFFFNA